MISGTCISIVNEVIFVKCGVCNAAQLLEFQENQVIANTKNVYDFKARRNRDAKSFGNDSNVAWIAAVNETLNS